MAEAQPAQHMPQRLISPRCLRLLTVSAAEHSRGMVHISAGSGLVCAHGRAYVMADDELQLAVFNDLASPGRLLRVRGGKLPADAAERKRLKPDFESLLLVPAHGRLGSALVALGSGSTQGRDAGVQMPLRRSGEPAGTVAPINLQPLYARLRQRLGASNIEGSFISGREWVLLNRGVGGQPSASVRYPVQVLHALMAGQPLAHEPSVMQSHDLGFIDGVQLAFTDGAALPGGGFMFSAAAEATDNSVDDGACVGSAIGHINGQGALVALRRLAGRAKVEGLALHVAGSALHLAMVTDADDPAMPSQLLLARW